MKSVSSMEIDTQIKIQRTLASINGITLKIKKELELIEDLVKENGYLHTVVNAANQTLSMEAQKIGINVAEIINKNKCEDGLEPNLLSSITSTIITEKLLDQIHG